MPQPVSSQVHVDAPLTNISVAYMQSEAAYVSDKAFPMLPVDKQTNKYFVYDKDDFFRDQMQRRAPASESAGGGWNLSTDSYSCDVWAFHKDIDDQTRANADSPIQLDRDTTRFITQIGMIRRERQWASDYFGAGVWSTDVVGGTDFTAWDNEAASDPIEDVKVGRLKILQTTGFKPNTLVVGVKVHEALKKHPLIIERYKHTSSESITNDMIARLLEVDRYLVAEAVFADNNEGAAENMQFILGNHALLCYSTPTPSLLMPTAGYCFVWRGLTGLNNLGVTISQFRIDKIKSDRTEIEMAFDMKKVAADMGYFFQNAAS